MRLFLTLTLLFWALGSLKAAQDDARLDPLFVQLQQSSSVWEAKVIENQIRTIWMEHEEEDINILMRKGALAIEMREFPIALQIFDFIIEKKPDFAEGFNQRAITHYLMENYEASIKDIRKAILLEPRHFNALSGLGFIHTKLKQYDEALEIFQKIAAIHPKFEGLEKYLSSLKKAVEATRV